MEEKIPKVKNNPLGYEKCLTAGYPASIFSNLRLKLEPQRVTCEVKASKTSD